jgi:hypothetical protein
MDVSGELPSMHFWKTLHETVPKGATRFGGICTRYECANDFSSWPELLWTDECNPSHPFPFLIVRHSSCIPIKEVWCIVGVSIVNQPDWVPNVIRSANNVRACLPRAYLCTLWDRECWVRDDPMI